MQPQHRQRIRDLFERAIELPPGERTALVDASSEPGTVKAEVHALLAALRHSGEYQHSSGIFPLPPQPRTKQPSPPPTTPSSATFSASAPASAASAFQALKAITPESMVGLTIGPYQLLEHIGEGGFGDVFRARQLAPVRRTVALKILKPGMDSHAILTRFEQELQALALMDHPGIARVLDAGVTPDSRPFVALEFVPGEPINTYCDSRRLPIRQRVELIKAVCDAVQHAHHRGIIHRDLKPSNVLVIPPDAPGSPPTVKVIDFGIAKATGNRLTETTIITGQRQLIGTPEYMSPEQAALDSALIDTRTDVYSLGILLYQLLTGTTPLDTRVLRAAPIATMQQLIHDSDPPRPSSRVRTLTRTHLPEPPAGSHTAPASATAAAPHPRTTDIAAARSTDLPRLTRQLTGELDWIVIKALENDRNRRYDTASALATDLERWLTGRAVEAGPPSGVYRLRVLIRRNRLSVAFAALILLALVLGLAISSIGFAQARTQRDLADAARQREAATRTDAERLLTRAALAAAAAGVQNGNAALALSNLSAVPPAQRQWEWNVLHTLADRGVTDIQLAPGERTTSIWPMKDPRRVLATLKGTSDSLAIIDLDAGQVQRRFPGTLGAVSPDDRLIAALAGGTIHVYDADSGRLSWSTPSDGRHWSLTFASFSPDSTQLVSTDGSGTLFCFDALTGAPRQSFTPTPPATDVHGFFTPEDRPQPQILYRNADRIFLYSPTTGSAEPSLLAYRILASRTHTGIDDRFVPFTAAPLLTRAAPPTTALVTSQDLSIDGRLAIFSDAVGGISLARRSPLNPSILQHAYRFPAGRTYLSKVALTSDARRIVMSSSDGQCSVVNTDAYALDFFPKIPRGSTVAISPDARVILRASWGEASALDSQLGIPLWSANLGGAVFSRAAFSPDSSRIALTTRPTDRRGLSELYILSAADGAPLLALGQSAVPELPGRQPSPPWLKECLALAFSADGTRLFLALIDGSVHAISAQTGKPLASRELSPAAAAEAEVALGRQRSSSILLPDAAAATIVRICPAFAPRSDGSPSATDGDSLVEVLDAATLEPIRSYPLRDALVTAAARSADGKALFLGTHRGSLLRLAADDGRVIWESPPSSPLCSALALSQDGRRLVASFNSSNLVCFETETGQQTAALPVPASATSAMAFSPDDSSLILAGLNQFMGRLDAAAAATAAPTTPSALAAWPATVGRPDSLRQARAWSLDAHQLLSEVLASTWGRGPALSAIEARTELDLPVRQLAAEIFRRRGYPLRESNNRALLELLDPAVTPRQLANAATLLADLIEQYPTDASAHLNLGEALFRLDRLDEAVAPLLKGDQLWTSRQRGPNPHAHSTLALIFARLDKPDQAARWLALADAQSATTQSHDDGVTQQRASQARELLSRDER